MATLTLEMRFTAACDAAIRRYTDFIVGPLEESGTDNAGDLECLLASLMHWSRARNVDFEAQLVKAHAIFRTEQHEDKLEAGGEL